MYFNGKEDTNIDNELKKEKKPKKVNKNVFIIGGIILIVLIISILIFFYVKNTKYHIKLLENFLMEELWIV